MKRNPDTAIAATTIRQKDFCLGDILSITTGRLVSRRKIDGVYDILNYMTGESLFTHQLPRAGEICRPELLKQFPQLAEVDHSSVCDPASAMSFLEAQIVQHGATLAVQPLSDGIYKPRHPVQEAIDMGAKNVIATDCSPESVEALVRELKES